MRLFLVVLLFLSTNIFSQPYRNQYQYIKVNFSELMSTEGLFDKGNYVCYDETGDSVIIRGVGYPQGQDTTGGVDYIILITDQWKYNISYTIKVY